MTRPLTSVERSAENKRTWREEEERRARESRGEQGHMEFWLRDTRAGIAKEVRAGRADVYRAFGLVCRLFKVAMERRARGDKRLWEDLLRYAVQVLEQTSPPN